MGNNIYLVGMMGSGKTSTAKVLAERLSLAYIELDSLIEKRAGKTINRIFEEDGEEIFRNLESELLGEVAGERDQVISTGGGVVIRGENRARMRSSGKVIYLKGSVRVLWSRLRVVKDRPLLKVEKPEKRLGEILKSRKAFYEEADFVVDTDSKKPEEIAEEIIGLLARPRTA
ncbi:MAG: shikimate kinase [Candidatus Omnitrophica bacterium]|nr:shikimate kinase [Candidatus Omnitrophota bacterium]